MIEFSKRVSRAAAAAWVMALALTGCGGDVKDAASATPPASTTASVGVEGGTVNGPDGVQVVIPAGALSKPTEIGIARSAVGAPATLPEDYTASAAMPTYEFTPHDIIFNTPVTIRIPTSSTAPSAEILMASPGEDWQVTDARISGGFAEWQRNSFSWGLGPFGCAPTNSAPYSSGNPDPYPCSIPRGYASASATPTAAITKVVAGNWGSGDFSNGSAGSWTVNQASTVRLSMNYQTAPDCQNPRAKLLRWNPAIPPGTPGRVQTLFDGPVALTATTVTPPPGSFSSGGTSVRGVGSTSHDVSFSHLDNGTSAFGYSFSCNRPSRPARSGGDLLTFVAAIPVPTVTYAIGGTVSGLTGAGLVLQNNSAGNLAVAANGAFSFATPLGAGAPYAVTVFTQPAGQTCSVQNGSGTANAAVSNVAVSCVTGTAAKAWQGAGLLETLDAGDAFEPQLAFDANGNGMAIWAQSDGTYFRIQSRRYTFSGGWGAVTPVGNGGAVMAFSPKIAADGLGNLMAVWLQPSGTGTTTSIWTNLYTAASGWGTATLLENNLSSVGGNRPEIAMDPAGHATVVWYAFDGTWTNLWAKRYAAGGAWGAATLIENDSTGGVQQNRVVMDASGNAMVVWVQTGFIYFNRYTVGSGWGTATRAHGINGRIPAELDIALDSASNMMMTWAQRDEFSMNLIYSSRYASGSWATAEVVHTSINSAAKPSVAMDGNGNAIVVWYEVDNFDVTMIWARRYVAGVGGTAVRIDDSSTYTTGGFPQISMDAAGNAMAVWNQGSFTWANRYVAGTGWAGATLIDETANGGSSSSPQVAVDANGNAIAVWSHSGVSGPNIWGNVFR